MTRVQLPSSRRELSLADRLTAGLVRMPNECLEWTGVVNEAGYGRIWVNNKWVLTHRLAWELMNGPIPDGLCVLHHCDNPPCCNAEKCLFLGTRADNNADREAKGRNYWSNITHCKRGHPFDETNTYVDPRGRRGCRKCWAARRRVRLGEPPNAEDRRKKLKTHCPAGHPYDEANTYVTASGKRHCKACKRVREVARAIEKRVEGDHLCPVDSCDRTFTTSQGLSLHRRHVHQPGLDFGGVA